MLDNHYELENEIIEEENDYETGDHNNHRPFTSDQGLTGKRPKVKTNNFYGLQSSERLPIMYPQSRPFSEKSGKPSGRPKGQNTSFKSHDRSSHMIAKDLEIDQSVRNLPSPKKYLAMIPSASQKNYKIIPRNIPQDKERLYDENLNLKNLVHHLREENLKLKTKVNVLEKESIRVEKMMAEQESNVVERDLAPKASENHLVVGLKNRLIEVENSLHDKEAELSKLKKSVKVTKITELEVQLKTFTEESYRLKGILEQLIKEKTQGKNEGKNKLQEENLIQAAQIKALEKDHEQLVKIVKAFEQQSTDYEKKLNECEKKKKSETQKLKKLVAEKEKENLRLQQELETVSSNIPVARASFTGKRPTIATREDLFAHEFEKKKAENSSLVEQLAEKNSQIQHLEKMLKEANKTPTDKPATLQHIERPAFRKPSERFSKPLTLNVTNNETAAQPVVEVKTHTIHTEELKKEKSVSHIEADKTIESEREESCDHEESGRINSVPRKRVQKLKAEDVKDLGYEINLSLRAKGVVFDDLNKIIWPQSAVQSGRLSIKEAIQVLRADHFNMKNEDDAILIARYLIEDNHDEYLYYDEETEGDLVIIKSILRKLIGPIPSWNKATTQKLHDSVTEICTKYHLSLRENLRVTCKDGNLNRKALQEVCKLIEVNMSDEQMEYIITKLFEKSNDIQNLAIESLFEIFYRPQKLEEVVEKPKEETKLPVQQTHQTFNQTTQKNSTPLSLLETKPKNEFTLPEKKPEQKTTESPLKPKIPSQEIYSQTEVKSNKSSAPKEKESPKEEKVLSELLKSEREEKSSRRNESRDEKEEYQSEKLEEEQEEKENSYENNKSEQGDEYADTPKSKEKKEVQEVEAVSDKEEEEQNEEEYKFEEEEEAKEEEDEQEEPEEDTKKSTHPKGQEVEHLRVAENNRQQPHRDHERTSSIEVSDSRRRLESQATNNTNTTQISDPRSEVFGVPSRNNNEERKGEDLNPISERDENTEIKREATEGKKTTKEEYESEDEYKEDVEEEVDEKEEVEEEEQEQEDEKEKVSQSKVAQKVKKAESDEEYNDEEGFEEEIDDDS